MVEERDGEPYSKYPIIRCKTSKIKFPEICPVCLEEAEDLVAITVRERSRSDATTYSSRESPEVVGAHERAVILWVPTCMQHGSKSVRSGMTRAIAILGFFVLFYPILFYLLQINASIYSGRPYGEYVIMVIILVSIMVILIIYGYYPRALERALEFLDIDSVQDYVYLKLQNEEYRRVFSEMNEMHMERIQTRELPDWSKK